MAAPADTLAAVEFSGYGIVAVAGAAFTYYALRNYALDRLEDHEDFWGYLSYLGFAVTAFGAFGILRQVVGGDLVTAFADVALLFAVAFAAFSMRELYYNSALAPPAAERGVPLPRLRRMEFGFVVVIAVEWVVVMVIDEAAVVAAVKGLGALAFAAYGVAFSEQLEELAHGTALDTLRRHLVFVLVCATGVATANLVSLVGADVVGTSMGYVFLVLLGGMLVPPTVRLQQSVAALR